MSGAGWRITCLAALAVATPAAARLRPLDIVPLPVPRPAFSSDLLAIPLPPPRPGDLAAPVVPEKPSQVAPTPLMPSPLAPSADNEAVCAALMHDGKVLATRLPPITGPGGCGIADPVELSAIKTDAGATIEFAPPIEVRCELAQALADWVRDDLVPITAALGDMRRIVDADAYECRGRNRVAGAKLSEHGKGNAVDVVSLAFANEHTLTLTAKDAGPSAAAIKASACRRFMTVLGPGSDGYHEKHIHLDLEARRSGMHLCEWTLPSAIVSKPTP